MARRPRKGSIRQVVTGHSDGYTARVPFARLGLVTIPAESMLAEDFLTIAAAYDDDLTEVISEPMRLQLRVGHWVPDYLFRRTHGLPELIEVKPVEEVHPDRRKTNRLEGEQLKEAIRAANARYSAMNEAAVANGYTFRLATEDEIRILPLLYNAELILRHAGHSFPKDMLLAGRTALTDSAIDNVAMLQAALPPTHDAFAIALHLTWTGDVELDPRRTYSRTSSFVRVGARRYETVDMRRPRSGDPA